jgi:hypothetical protein
MSWAKGVVWGCCNRDSVPSLRSPETPNTLNTSKAAEVWRESIDVILVLPEPCTMRANHDREGLPAAAIKVLRLGTFHSASLAHIHHLPSPAAPSHQMEGTEAASPNIDGSWGWGGVDEGLFPRIDCITDYSFLVSGLLPYP